MGLDYNRNRLISKGVHPKDTLCRFLRSPPISEVKRSASFPTGKLNQISDSRDGPPGTEFREKPYVILVLLEQVDRLKSVCAR